MQALMTAAFSEYPAWVQEDDCNWGGGGEHVGGGGGGGGEGGGKSLHIATCDVEKL